MRPQTISGAEALRLVRRSKLGMDLANKFIRGGSRAYRTTARSVCRSTIGTINGSRILKTTLPRFAKTSNRLVTRSIINPTARSFGTSCRQFVLPNGQIGPIRSSSRLSTPSSLLQKTHKSFQFRQKANRSTCTRPAQSRKQTVFRKRFSTTRSNRKANTKSESNDSSLGARMKRLSREYGWSALGVYLMLSALDFPFCYLLVRYLGADRIDQRTGFQTGQFSYKLWEIHRKYGEWEETIISYIKSAIPESVRSTWHEWRVSMKEAERELTGAEKANDAAEMAGWGVEEAEAQNNKEASLTTQLALAYAIHKSFIFIRVPLTAAITPRVVKILRSWGWDIGKKTSKAAKAAKRAKLLEKKSAAKKKLEN